jgi:uroporphyrinogen decarboxylase
MTERENLLSLLRRKGFDHIPVDFNLCPFLSEVFRERTGCDADYRQYFNFPWRFIGYDDHLKTEPGRYREYYNDLKPGAVIDCRGVAHEPGSRAAGHMTHMRHPLEGVGSMDGLKEYPWPSFDHGLDNLFGDEVKALHGKGIAACGSIVSPVWEYSWYLRGMETLMMDMMSDDPMAEFVLDKVTGISVEAAGAFAASGADILHMGDDIGMQHGIMMSVGLFGQWLLPRIKKVIRAAKDIKPDMLVFFHSCGYIKPFIPLLIEAGVDILNPIQPESMRFEEVYPEFGEVLSFHGTVGTQTTMPFGNEEDVRKEVLKNLKTAGAAGGLFPAPTHMLEPKVPWRNILAYVEACREFTA